MLTKFNVLPQGLSNLNHHSPATHLSMYKGKNEVCEGLIKFSLPTYYAQSKIFSHHSSYKLYNEKGSFQLLQQNAIPQ